MLAFLATLIAWANVPYTIALVVVVFSFLFQLVGLLPGSNEADADHSIEGGSGGDAGGHALEAHAPEAEVGVDVDHDVDVGGAGADHDVDVGGAGADHDADVGGAGADHDADVGGAGAGHVASAGSGHALVHAPAGAHGPGDARLAVDHGPGGLLGALGVGKVPLSIVWQTLFVMFGLTGVSATTIIGSFVGHLPTWLLGATLPIAILGGMALTSATVRLVARLVPQVSGEASSRRDLVGCSGVVISSKVDEEFGEVRLKDPADRTIRMICATHTGERPIPEGTEVVVTDWDKAHDRLLVTATARLLEGKSDVG